MEWADSFLAAQGDPAEPFDSIEKAFNQVAFFVEMSGGFWMDCSAGVRLDLCGCMQVINDEIAKMVRIICGITNDVLHASFGV